MRIAGLALLISAVLLSACAGGTPAGPESPDLEGTSWVVTHIRGEETTAEPQPTVGFQEGTISGNASCNSYGGEFTLDGSQLQIEEVFMTAMACLDDGVSQQESAFMTALGEVSEARMAGDTLELFDADGTAVLSLREAEPVEDVALEGTEWILTGIIEGESVASPVLDSEVRLTIEGSRLHGQACNTFNASITVGDGQIDVEPIVSTRMACPSQDLTEQEAKVLSILEEATEYAIAGSQLTISSPASGLLFVADE